MYGAHIGAEGFKQGASLGLYQAPEYAQRDPDFQTSRKIGMATTVAAATVVTAGVASAAATGTTVATAMTTETSVSLLAGQVGVGFATSGEAMIAGEVLLVSAGAAAASAETGEDPSLTVQDAMSILAAGAGGHGAFSRRGRGPQKPYNRVKLRAGTVDDIKANQPRNASGQMIDPNTKKPLNPERTDIGHKRGQEWRTRKQMHVELESTREEVIEAENDPDLYQLEDRYSNRSHIYEDK
jgi:hypothetical protein